MNFWTKYYAIGLAKQCAAAAIEVAGTNPVDHDGKWTLPDEPIAGDWEHFHDQMKSWATDEIGEEEEDVFETTYRDVMDEYKRTLRRDSDLMKATRKALGLTQSQMAEKMGLSLRGYQDKEYGRRPITKQDEIILETLKKNQP